MMNKKTGSALAFAAALSIIASGCRQTNEGGNNIPSLDEVTISVTEASDALETDAAPETSETETTTVTTPEETEETTEETTEYESEEAPPLETTAPVSEETTVRETTSGSDSWTETYMDAEMYVTEKCYSRERAIVGSTPISQYFPGDTVKVVAITDTGYFKLDIGGFIHSDYISDRKPSVNELTTTAPEEEKEEETEEEELIVEDPEEEKKPEETTAVTEAKPAKTEAENTSPAPSGGNTVSGGTAISSTGKYSVKPSSRYAYKQLSATEQVLYMNFVNSAMNLDSVVPIPEGMSKDDVVKVFSVVYNSEPQLFWLGSSISAGSAFATISYRTTDKSEIASMQAEIDKAASSILSKANNYSGTVSKLKVFYDTIITKNEFSISDSGFSSSVYNGLTGKGGLQCAGYAKTMQYLCDMAGIECCVVVGTNNEGTSHAWNVVYCQNGYYNLDATWGDPRNDYDSSYIQYEYFLVPDAWIHNKTHCNVNTTYRGNGTAIKLFDPPACTKEGCNYFAAYNKLFDSEEAADKAILAEIDAAIAEGKNVAEIRVSSQSLYEKMTVLDKQKAVQKYAKEKSSKVAKLKISKMGAEFGVIHYDIVYN